ncbi:MAG TPA: hypothetical protein PKA54_06870 [Chitinophagaceae bacterium]|nr:MAG: lvivd repeat-containing protein [Bacteroidetes bacterium OLB11]HMN33077.1 hypothetical protein [Chitinophagaceae bacterium]
MNKQFLHLIGLFAFLFFTSCEKDSTTTNSPTNSGFSGKGGSLAKFTIVNQYLYTIDGEYLSTFDISNSSNPILKSKQKINFDIEALFPFKNKLFIASNSAMYIFSLNNPESPTMESNIGHFTGCDPIVANDLYAFLTVHGGTRCGSTINELQVYSIKNLFYPQLLTRVPMINPFGLGLQNNTLFVCDNGVGIKVFDVSNPSEPKSLSIITGENFVDVIPMGNYMICMLSDGVAFYDISNRNNIQKLSVIKN